MLFEAMSENEIKQMETLILAYKTTVPYIRRYPLPYFIQDMVKYFKSSEECLIRAIQLHYNIPFDLAKTIAKVNINKTN